MNIGNLTNGVYGQIGFTSSAFTISSTGGNDFVWQTSPGSTERMRIKSGGFVGIGSSAIGNDMLVVNQPNSFGDIFSASQAGSAKFVITNEGNVGISITIPLIPEALLNQRRTNWIKSNVLWGTCLKYRLERLL